MSTQQQRRTLQAAIEAMLAEPNFYTSDLVDVVADVLEARTLSFGRPLGATCRNFAWELADKGKRREEWRKSHLPVEPLHLTCDACGEPFTAWRSDARYCSARCRQRAHRRPA